MSASRVCLVGAGAIAASHAEALSLLGIEIAALVEPSPSRAEKFAGRWKIARVYSDLRSALEAGGFDAVHILTPPDTHAALARDCIASGVAVMVEKPVAETAADGALLVDEAARRHVFAGVNQNFVFHPAFARLRRDIDRGMAGPIRKVIVAYNVPLRQLTARQFGAWMFAQPGNILLEQAVHPLSQIVALLGPVDGIVSVAPASKKIAHNVDFFDRFDVILTAGEKGAHLQFAVGCAFPFWQLTAVCDDAVLVADMLNNRYFRIARGPSLEPLDIPIQALKTAGQIVADGLRGIADYVLSLAKLKKRSDPFFVSMLASIRAFHGARRGEVNERHTDLAFGAELVRICESVAKQCVGPPPAPAVPIASNLTSTADVVLLGGTGFIGSATTARLVKAGLRVRVVARNTRNLASVFHHPAVSVVAGDIGRANDVSAVIDGAQVVVNLAHGGGGESWAEIERALVGGARMVAEACAAKGVRQLIHIGSIAGLYLGDPAEIISGNTPPDPASSTRADYARAKADADRMLMELSDRTGLPICILRPGLVVGEGTSPFHSGLGMFNNEQFCIGWNNGLNPLPLVLVDDVAEAIFNAVQKAGGIGKAYNLVGDVRLSARDYIAALAAAIRRPLVYRPSMVTSLFAQELAKWLIKRAVGRGAARPSLRDLKSRGLLARFDCGDAQTDLLWKPVADRETFIRKAFTGI